MAFTSISQQPSLDVGFALIFPWKFHHWWLFFKISLNLYLRLQTNVCLPTLCGLMLDIELVRRQSERPTSAARELVLLLSWMFNPVWVLFQPTASTKSKDRHQGRKKGWNGEDKPSLNIQMIDGDHELDLVADAVGIPHCSLQFTPLTSIPGISLPCCDLLGYKPPISGNC